jgi:diacylglycerol kinase family enzyme
MNQHETVGLRKIIFLSIVILARVKPAYKRSTPDGSIQRYRARKIKVRTSPTLDIAVEGIILGKGTARIKILPGALQVLAPEPGPVSEKPQEEKTSRELPEPASPVSH